MPLYEFYCQNCRIEFEQITSSTDPNRGKCMKCNQKNTKKLFSKFAVGGQGDLRESTQHGCHDCEVSLGDGHSSGSQDGHSST